MNNFFKHLATSFLFLVAFVALQIGATVITQLLWKPITGEEATGTTFLIVGMAVFGVSVIALFLLARWASVSVNYVRTRPWTTLFWCVLAAIGGVIPSMWMQETFLPLPDFLTEQMGEILRHKWGYLVVVIVAPFAEELIFRGAILRVLLDTKKNHWLMIAISALMFALIHGNPAQMPHAFLGGILLGWMYYRTRSIVPCLAYHWANNAVGYVMYNVIPDPNASLSTIFGGNNIIVLLSVLFSLCILIPAIVQLNLHMKPATPDSQLKK